MALTKATLLAEIGTLFLGRNTETFERNLGDDLKVYKLSGVLLRLNNIAEQHEINFTVFKEGVGGQEVAAYMGDVLSTIFRRKVDDFIHVTQGWIGTIQKSRKPLAICRVIKTPVSGEEWVQIEETSPGNFTSSDITGSVIV
ncbi:MAG: hypothetical protein V3U54_13145 [Thermodesulfobacteriota bacterium]